jgi:tetratricopeptide (TPR) repeat protein
LLDALVQSQPRWLAEGLGCLLETIRVDADGTVRIGAPPKPRLAQLLSMGKRPLLVSELRAWRRITFGDENRSLYASSWLLVHWLVFARPPAFADLQRRLARGEDPDAALRSALPDLGDDQLDVALREWLDDRVTGNQWPVYATRIDATTPSLSARPLPPAEAHALRAALALLAPGETAAAERRAKAKAQIDLALAADATNVAALLALRRLPPRPADLSQRLRAASAAHPRDWRAHWALARSLDGVEGAAPERLRALRAAARLSPFSAPALHDLARAQLEAGNVTEALAFASGAARLAPAHSGVLTTFAAALFRARHCDEAVRVMERACAVLRREAPDSEVRRLREMLEQLRSRCAPQ